MAIFKTENPALVLIDLQKGFEDSNYWGAERNNPDAEKNAAELLDIWRNAALPIFHIQHCSTLASSPLNPAHKGNDFMDLVRPKVSETIIQKNVNSAFIGTNLKELLDQQNISELVIVGLTTDHCISTTTRMASNLGFDTILVSDACATFNKTGIDAQNFSAELMHQTALASLDKEFARVVSMEFVKENMKNQF